MRRAIAFSIALAAAVSACDRKPTSALAASANVQARADDGYLASPSVTRALAEPGRLALEGQAEPGAKVRLATPAGVAMFADADAKGRWRIATAATPEPRIFGLSMTAHGRQVQSQGYVLTDPAGKVTILRAGAGAVVLEAGDKPRITTFDYDREGGAVVSGVAPAGASVAVRGDGAALGESRADSAGRFSVPITRPVSAGQHRVQIVGESFSAAATVDVAPPAPLTAGPFRSRRTPLGLRADWMTPGGGVQTTLILN